MQWVELGIHKCIHVFSSRRPPRRVCTKRPKPNGANGARQSEGVSHRAALLENTFINQANWNQHLTQAHADGHQKGGWKEHVFRFCDIIPWEAFTCYKRCSIWKNVDPRVESDMKKVRLFSQPISAHTTEEHAGPRWRWPVCRYAFDSLVKDVSDQKGWRGWLGEWEGI